MSVNALLAQASQTIIASNKDEIQAEGDQVARRNEGIRKNNDAAAEITKDMRGVEQDAVDMHEKAEDTKWPARIFRVKKHREHKARKLDAAATQLSGEAETIDMKSERARNANEDDLEVMKAKSENVEKAVEFVGKIAANQGGLNL